MALMLLLPLVKAYVGVGATPLYAPVLAGAAMPLVGVPYAGATYPGGSNEQRTRVSEEQQANKRSERRANEQRRIKDKQDVIAVAASYTRTAYLACQSCGAAPVPTRERASTPAPAERPHRTGGRARHSH